MNCELEIQDRVFLPKQGKPSYSGRGTGRLKFIFDGINMYIFCVSAVWDEGNYTDLRCDEPVLHSFQKLKSDKTASVISAALLPSASRSPRMFVAKKQVLPPVSKNPTNQPFTS